MAWVAASCLVATLAVVLPWRWIAPPTTAFIARAQLEANEEPVLYRWVDRKHLSSSLVRCVLASEDQKFPSHFGFDFASIWDAAQSRGGARRGASTITQQVAKNLFLWSGRSYLRKGIEAYLALWLELLWPKQRILEVYLNVAQFGPRVFGAAAASQHYFGKPPSALSLEEAALLAAVLPNPRRLSVARPSAYVRERAYEIAAEARRLGPDGLDRL